MTIFNSGGLLYHVPISFVLTFAYRSIMNFVACEISCGKYQITHHLFFTVVTANISYIAPFSINYLGDKFMLGFSFGFNFVSWAMFLKIAIFHFRLKSMRTMMLRGRGWLDLYFGEILINFFLQRQIFSSMWKYYFTKSIETSKWGLKKTLAKLQEHIIMTINSC